MQGMHGEHVNFVLQVPKGAGACASTSHEPLVVVSSKGNNQVENLWLQPLDGSAGKQITNFKTDTIKIFGYSPDGKQLGAFRPHVESDVVIQQDAGSGAQ
jgi:hypothetical protein